MNEEQQEVKWWSSDEVLDMSELYDLQYCVAINQGHRDDCGFVCSTLRGPFGFDDMVGQVHSLWTNDLDHAKVIILSTDRNSPLKCLDTKTIEYIQMRAGDILMERMLGIGKPATCSAGFVEASPEEKRDEQVDKEG